MSALSDWIKERRRTLGLSQMQVATRLGVNQGQVSHLENGKFMPDTTLMIKIDEVFGKFTGSYTPVQAVQSSDDGTKKMSDKAKEGLKAYRDAKDNTFYLKLDDHTFITADKNQYILKQGANASYFTDMKSLLKHLVVSQMRQSAVDSVQEICDKIDETYKLIEKKFGEYDPANIAESSNEEYIPDDE